MRTGNSSTRAKPSSSFGTSRSKLRNGATVTISKLIAIATTAAALCLLVYGIAAADQQPYLASALALFTIGLFASGAIPPHVTAIWFFLLAVLAGIAPAETIFSGFASMGFWMVFGGLLIGIAVRETGLASRAARAQSQ